MGRNRRFNLQLLHKLRKLRIRVCPARQSVPSASTDSQKNGTVSRVSPVNCNGFHVPHPVRQRAQSSFSFAPKLLSPRHVVSSNFPIDNRKLHQKSSTRTRVRVGSASIVDCGCGRRRKKNTEQNPLNQVDKKVVCESMRLRTQASRCKRSKVSPTSTPRNLPVVNHREEHTTDRDGSHSKLKSKVFQEGDKIKAASESRTKSSSVMFRTIPAEISVENASFRDGVFVPSWNGIERSRSCRLESSSFDKMQKEANECGSLLAVKNNNNIGENASERALRRSRSMTNFQVSSTEESDEGSIPPSRYSDESWSDSSEKIDLEARSKAWVVCPAPDFRGASINRRRRERSRGRLEEMRKCESVAVVKCSTDPYMDFRDSMVEMILEKQLVSSSELERLLECFLQLNAEEHHGMIVRAFTEVWEKVFGVGA